MFKWILLALLCINSFALEVSINIAKENFTRYSTLNITHENSFVCQEIKDDFENVTEVICAFSKRPSSDIKELQNDFFKVITFIRNDTFFISIKPFYKIKLIANIFDLSEDDEIYTADVDLSKSWTILGYKNKLPLIEQRKKPDNSINFPFFLAKDKLPFVGSLDIKGNPVFLQEVGDVTDYLRVKKLYKAKQYENCMDVINTILDEYPNTLFKAELLYYKIKIYAGMQDYDNVVDNAKIYLQEYSANENIAEVLSLIAQAYSKIGMSSDAKYFFDRLFSEHRESVFSEWGHLYQAEMLEENAATSKAVAIYKQVLYSTQNINVAVSAAFNLAKLKLDTSPKEAGKYIDKIISAKPSYFKEQYKTSKEMMEAFIDNNQFLSAAKIAGALLDAINPTYDDYELLLSEKALWLAQTQEKKEALSALNKYIKQFPDGDYIDKVQVAKDKLFFDTNDANSSVKLAEYDKLIEEYSNDTIGARAKYEKAKLLLSVKKYKEVLDMKEDIIHLDMDIFKDKENLIVDAATGEMQEALKSHECARVLKVSHEYNITLSDDWDDGIYTCAMKGGDYQLSKKIAEKNFKSKNLEFRKKWLYRYIKVDFATGNYSDVLSASKDLITLIKEDKEREYNGIYRYLFDTYDRLEMKDKMLEAIVEIEKVFGLTYKDIERYVSVMSIGSERNDDNIVINYGSKVEKIQKRSNSYAQSPYVEFTLYQAYMNKEEYAKALETIEILEKVELNKKDRSRQKYLLGTVLNKLWRNDAADKAFDAAIEADKDSSWAKLAQSAKEL